jgi:hypothetical protein
MYPDEKNRKAPSKIVPEIVKMHKGLSELAEEYPWIVAFLKEAVRGRLSMAQSVSSALECVTEAEAKQMGKSLAKALRARKTAKAGVYQWKRQNRSMKKLFKKYPWVEEMVTTMSEEVRAASGERQLRERVEEVSARKRSERTGECLQCAKKRRRQEFRSLTRVRRSRTRSCSRRRPGGCGSGCSPGAWGAWWT